MAAHDGLQSDGANTASKLCSEKEIECSIDSNDDLAHIWDVFIVQAKNIS